MQSLKLLPIVNIWSSHSYGSHVKLSVLKMQLDAGSYMDLVGFYSAESYFLIGLLDYCKKLITNKNGQINTTEQKYK